VAPRNAIRPIMPWGGQSQHWAVHPGGMALIWAAHASLSGPDVHVAVPAAVHAAPHAELRLQQRVQNPFVVKAWHACALPPDAAHGTAHVHADVHLPGQAASAVPSHSSPGSSALSPQACSLSGRQTSLALLVSSSWTPNWLSASVAPFAPGARSC